MTAKPPLPVVAVTMGDPSGIGPEICLALLANECVRSVCVPLVFGNADLLARVAGKTGRPMPEIVTLEQKNLSSPPKAGVVDIEGPSLEAIKPGEVSAEAGGAALGFIEQAIGAAQSGFVDAVTTGPVHKEALFAAGCPFPGHTEIFAARTGTKRVCMMLTSPKITCSLVTTHIGLREVPDALSVERIQEVIELTHALMRRRLGKEPRLQVLALNPHAGEGGLFGVQEEERLIAPAIAHTKAMGIHVAGPVPPDTAFLPDRLNETDAYVCMYHDQGLIPLKMLAFDDAVNVTLGLPMVRTSVDHGTAFDIAWKGIAKPASLIAAVCLAAQLASSDPS